MSTKQQASDATQWFWSDVGHEIYDSLTQNQRSAIETAAEARVAEGIRSDVRLSFGRWFLVVLFGRERRGVERLKQDRENRPVIVYRNLPIIILLWGSVVFTAYSLFGFGLQAFIRMLG